MVNLSKRLIALEAQFHPPEEAEAEARQQRGWAAIIELAESMRAKDLEQVLKEQLDFVAGRTMSFSLLTGQVWHQINGAVWGNWEYCLNIPGEIADLWLMHGSIEDKRNKKDWLQCVECFSGIPYFRERIQAGSCVMPDGRWNKPPIPEFRYASECLLCGGRLADWFDVRWGRA